MELGLDGRTALVCASTGGLGLASARALAAEGARVVITGRRGELAREIAAGLPGAVAIEIDLTTPTAAAELLTQARAAVGEIDVLVLNGPGPALRPAVDLDAAGVAGAVDLLLTNQVELVHRTLPGMRERGWGRIVAIGSSGMVEPLPGLVASNLGRAALAGYLKTVATEVAGDGVTVNVVLPGRIATDRLARIDHTIAERSGRAVDAVRVDAEAAIPAGRYGRPEEFGSTVAFLCGTPASYVTGSMVRCDGGLISGT